jgi:hypothetical protein
MLVRIWRIKYIINLKVHFVGYLYITDINTFFSNELKLLFNLMLVFLLCFSNLYKIQNCCFCLEFVSCMNAKLLSYIRLSAHGDLLGSFHLE